MTRSRGDSGSAGESGHTTMGDTSSSPDDRKLRAPSLRRGGGGRRILDDDDEERLGEEDDEEKNEMWQTFSKSFHEVQTVLDQNRALIQQVNDNHQSKIPDNLTKNVDLIREINGNMGKVVSLYSNLSADFSNMVHQRKKQHRPIA